MSFKILLHPNKSTGLLVVTIYMGDVAKDTDNWT